MEVARHGRWSLDEDLVTRHAALMAGMELNHLYRDGLFSMDANHPGRWQAQLGIRRNPDQTLVENDGLIDEIVTPRTLDVLDLLIPKYDDSESRGSADVTLNVLEFQGSVPIGFDEVDVDTALCALRGLNRLDIDGIDTMVSPGDVFTLHSGNSPNVAYGVGIQAGICTWITLKQL